MGRPINKEKYITNFDYDGFYTWCKNNDYRLQDIANDMGFNGAYFANCRTRNAIKRSSYIYLITRYQLEEGSFLLKEEKKDKTVSQSQDMSELMAEMKELHTSINRIGNILMQLLEYASEMRKEREVNDRR